MNIEGISDYCMPQGDDEAEVELDTNSDESTDDVFELEEEVDEDTVDENRTLKFRIRSSGKKVKYRTLNTGFNVH